MKIMNVLEETQINGTISPCQDNNCSDKSTVSLDTNLTEPYCFPLDEWPCNLDFVEKTSTAVFFAFLLVVGVTGNSLSFYFYKNSEQNTNVFFFALLSFLDLLTCIMATLIELLEWEVFAKLPDLASDIICKFTMFFITSLVEMGMAMLLIIAVDRYRRICTPFGAQIDRALAKRLCISAAILVSILSSYTIATTVGTKRDCVESKETLPFLLIYKWVELGLIIIVNAALLIIYALIIRGLIKAANKRVKLQEGNSKSQQSVYVNKIDTKKKRTNKIKSADRTLTRMAMGIMVVYLISFAPYVYNNMDTESYLTIDLYGVLRYHAAVEYHIFRHLCSYSVFLNSALNPIVYGIFNKNFRLWLNEIFKCS